MIIAKPLPMNVETSCSRSFIAWIYASFTEPLSTKARPAFQLLRLGFLQIRLKDIVITK